MKIELVYRDTHTPVISCGFIPCVGDWIWDESQGPKAIYRVSERDITIDKYRKISKVSIVVEKP